MITISRYANGQPVRLTTTIRDTNGNPIDPGGITLTVRLPDASTTVYPTPVHQATGVYLQDVPASPDLAQLGHYQYKWVSVGVGAGVSVGDFDVYDPFEPSILPLQDAKDTVNIPQSTTTYDAELQAMVDTVTAAIESLTGGPAVTRTISERSRLLNNTTFAVRKRPLVAVTSITDIGSGQQLTVTNLDVDTLNGLICQRRMWPFYGWGPWYQIVYTAGWGTSVPAAFNLSARIIVNHLWETARGPGQMPTPGLEEVLLPGMAYAIPNRAIEVLRGTDPGTGLPYLQEAYV